MGSVAAVNRNDSLAVAQFFARALYTWDAAIDVSWLDGQRRAVSLMTPKLAADLTKPLRPRNPMFSAIAPVKGYTKVVIHPGQEPVLPPPSPTYAIHTVHIVVSAVGNGVTMQPDEWTVWLEMQKLPAGWAVNAYHVKGPGGY